MGAICQLCKRDMLKTDGCDKDTMVVGGVQYEQIKVGSLGDFFEGEAGARCGDCNAAYGHYHHAGCDCERCPICGGQLLTCGCFDSDER